MAVEGDFARQSEDEIRAGRQELRRPPGELRLVLAEPQDLGSQRLAAEAVATQPSDRLTTVAPLQLFDLWSGACIDAIENRRADRPTRAINRHEARTKGADPNGGDPVAGWNPPGELAGKGADFGPPDRIRVHLCPSGLGHMDGVARVVLGQDTAIRPAKDAFRAIAADIDAEKQVSHDQALTGSWPRVRNPAAGLLGRSRAK